MNSTYHSGELEMQKRAGAVEAANRIGRTIYPVIAHVFVDFIQSQSLVTLGVVDGKGMVWASIVSGPPGFIEVVDERTLRIHAVPDRANPISESLRDGHDVGLLIIDFSTRRRLRLNGRVIEGADGFSIRTRQVYSNCPRYIQTRTCEFNKNETSLPRTVQQAAALDKELQKWISNADTFFVASFHPLGGADISHRGGFPGFIQVVDDGTIVWPEYNGNGMFNTLGNLIENPDAGLLFVDFEKGDTLQLSGTAEILWDEERAAFFPGAERLVKFKVRKVITAENAIDLRCKFENFAPDNPWFG